MTFPGWIAFLLAAGLGAPCRFVIDSFVGSRTRGDFPWGTLMVNTSGCLLLGALVGLGMSGSISPALRTVVGTGGLGAYTTFSTFSFQTIELAESGSLGLAARNVVANSLLGIAAAVAGLLVTGAIG